MREAGTRAATFGAPTGWSTDAARSRADSRSPATRYGPAIAAALAVLAVAATGPLAWTVDVSPRLYSPPPAIYLAAAAVAWLVVQLLLAIGSYTLGPLPFGVGLTATLVSGLTFFTYGRYGFVGGGWIAWAGCTTAAFVTGAAATALLASQPLFDTPAARTLRLFFVLCFLGAVYQFAATPANSLAQLRATSAATLLMALLSFRRRRIATLVGWLMAARVASTLFWLGAVILMIGNTVLVRLTHAPTPQASIGGVSIAPYFLASWLMLIAAGLELQQQHPRRALARIAVGWIALSAISAVGMKELGSVMAWTFGLVLVIGFFAPPRWTFGVIAALIVTGLLLRSEPVTTVVAKFSPRAAERLTTWSGATRPPDQFLRIVEMRRLAGVVGAAGAARVQLLIGPQATNDYIAVVALAEGGWLGLTVIVLLLLIFFLELFQSTTVAAPGLPLAIAVSVFVLFASNAIATLTWIASLTPFAGMPVPLLARGGSHLVVGAFGVALVDVLRPHATWRQP